MIISPSDFQKVVNLINQSAELLQLKSFESATHALEIITEALSISSYSEKLLELKGEALFRVFAVELSSTVLV